jgi:hypothetical protein
MIWNYLNKLPRVPLLLRNHQSLSYPRISQYSNQESPPLIPVLNQLNRVYEICPRARKWQGFIDVLKDPAKPSTIFPCKIWGFHGTDYDECRLPGYKNPVCTSQETHNVSATESSQLMICKIWGFHGCDYEECSLLEYKNPVLTSQETHDVSVTESSQLMLCKIWGFHGCDYEECRLLGNKNPDLPHRRHMTSPLQSPAS